MSQKKLGKSLSDLGLTELLSEFNHSSNSTESPTFKDLSELPIEQLVPSRLQPRRHFDEESLIELADSIKSQGILQPLIVRSISTSQFEIIAGERRWRAAQLANLRQVPVLIRSMTDQDAIAVALIENIQRRDLNVLEEAHALQRLLEEFQLTHQEVAAAVGKSRTAISNLLRLLNLTSEVKALLDNNQLEMGHARTLLTLAPLQQISAAQHIITKQLSVRATEQYVRQLLAGVKIPIPLAHTTAVDTPDIAALQQQLAKKFGAKVVIQQKTKDKGKLIIHYKNFAKLRSLFEEIV